MKKIGIIGSGIVAKTLGSGLKQVGYEVMLGSRNTHQLEDFIAENNGIKVGSFDEAAAFGDLIILAVKGAKALSALGMIQEDHIHGKTVMDATNPIADEPIEDGVLKFFGSEHGSLMEDLQHQYPEIAFVKAFNSVGSAQMVHPNFEIAPSMFICGNNEQAKQEVKTLTEALGWEVEDMGSAKAAASIESLCMLWCIKGFRENHWNHAFKILKP